jgi:hypothetical protein
MKISSNKIKKIKRLLRRLDRGGLECRHVGEVLWSACLLYFKFIKPGFH